jgi:AraC-like DNA-binding protein
MFVSAALAGLFGVYLITLKAEPRPAHRWLGAVFGVFAIQSGLSGLQIISPDQPILWLRPLTAMLIGPLFFLHLSAAANRNFTLTLRTALHLLGPALMVLTRLVISDGWYLDVMILISVTTYAGLIAWQISPVVLGQQKWKRVVVAWLVAMAIADLIVGFEMIALASLDQSISMLVMASGLLIFFAYFLLASLHQEGPLAWIATRLRATPTDSDLRLRLEAHMQDIKPWLDPELTIARLSRQLAVPQRQISELINDQLGTIFSRWINSYRIAQAQSLMREAPKRPLVELMLDAGFQTKSNFNKAFKDETGTTPSAWRKANCG